jgi:GNAT superfamily N-acetyltransferase
MISNDNLAETYRVEAVNFSELTEGNYGRCVEIITKGNAVDPASAGDELKLARMLVVARIGVEIVGVGAVKRIRRDYASKLARLSGFDFDSDTPELGYVAVDPDHRGKRLSHRIVGTLLSGNDGPLFATTSNDRMKTTLENAGFAHKGNMWKSERNGKEISLWMRQPGE